MWTGRQFLLMCTASFLACFHATAQNAATAEQASPSDSPPIKFQVLERRTIDLGNRSLFLNRVVPPKLPPAPAPTPSPPEPQFTLEQKQALAEREAKQTVVLFLSVTVYDRKVSELRWSDARGSHRAFSNIDFSYLAGMGGFETPDTSYTLMMGLGNETRAERIDDGRSLTTDELKNDLQLDDPPATNFSATRSEYVIVEDKSASAPPAEDLTALDTLHVYFDANKQRLIDEYDEREAANAARKQWLEEHPPVPKDTVINYWVGEGVGTTILKKQGMGGRP